MVPWACNSWTEPSDYNLIDPQMLKTIDGEVALIRGICGFGAMFPWNFTPALLVVL